eukprot:3802142-Lingulodinium_polyedra.AAC.1
MPCIPGSPGDGDPHRDRIAPPTSPFSACVARPVGKAELEREPEAQKARDKEWQRLRDKDVWDEDHPREWDDIRAEAKASGVDVHL